MYIPPHPLPTPDLLHCWPATQRFFLCIIFPMSTNRLFPRLRKFSHAPYHISSISSASKTTGSSRFQYSDSLIYTLSRTALGNTIQVRYNSFNLCPVARASLNSTRHCNVPRPLPSIPSHDYAHATRITLQRGQHGN
ncbi:hypothetical protein SeMB42_g05099 [Synchytrium endobioticum]|uniref:Uncharacterized protein n=1 Tax=Synchytrium endobioticum TaxID=286115 RepID=A0A507CTJ6_9FUNG|nr:hypothetical protein SeMB42_g05099 [Synchytrium endobioticum]